MRARSGLAVTGFVPLLLLVVDPAGWYPFGPVKALVASVGVLVLAALTLAPARSARPALVAAGALVAVLAVAAIVGEDPLYAWTGTPERRAGVVLWVLCGLALAVGASVGRPWVERHGVERGVLAAGLGVGAVGLAEALGWEPAVLAVGTRLTGTFGSSAYLGAACALLLPVLVGLALPGTGDQVPPSGGEPDHGYDGGADRWERVERALAGVAAVLVALTLVGTGARSAWVGVAGAAVVVLLVRPAPVRWKVGLGAAAVVGVGMVLVATPAGPRLVALGDADAPGGRARLDEWRVAARVVADHPVLGVGPEGYRIAFPGAVDEGYEAAHGRDPLPDRAHSAPLDLALAGGVPGLVAWLAVWAIVLRRGMPLVRHGPPALAGVAAALVAHVVGQLTLFPLAEVEPVAWLLAGVVVAQPRPAPARSPHGPARSPHGAVRVARWACAALAVVAAVAGGRDVLADRDAGRAVDALAVGDGRAALAAADDAVARRPDEVRLHLLRARARVAAGEGTEAALAAVEDAAAVSPDDPVVRRERARLLVQRAAATEVPADAAVARVAVEDALDADPVSGDLWLLAGEAARLDGDPDAAARAWTRAEALTPARPDAALDLALLHAATGDDAAARAALDRARAIAPDDPRIDEVERLVAGR